MIPRPRTPRRFLVPVGAVLGIALVLLVVAFLEGDFPEELTDARGLAQFVLGQYGVAGSFCLLYLEESGIPLPVPGDVYVAYLGRQSDGDVAKWIGAWLGIILVVVGGSSNLYLVSQRWGRRLLQHRIARFFHLDPARIAAAEGWFDRWGMVTIIFGRHIPGLRVPITVAAGISRVRYRVFAPSVAISTAVWAGVWLFLGARFGPSIGRFFAVNSWALGIAGAVIIAVIAVVLFRGLRRVSDEGESTAANPPPS
jgi:membrane protein DedA with SNARE-associated domain